ncbi:CAMK/CAMK1/CAMK1-RCK protein kinase [Blastomyces dermatitidis ER-3]|uniref:CAMK/CAMK1/CAMK1-RCK protein kinase n=4 Tax=Ajellomyces dermatitidis TaxID=5039 RepID=F2TLZ2_AJEDA|nr:CAMK/CAMK1/CAMK1-RCK protein kinase [Blastomyces dermatitidis ER-3]EEQ86719.1 CAMK/CAMK1/CAMK1-RCK protein kinase [Blastomyces dermatitidis ER-3]EGE84255.2 CAMK/CAMK1/CAMK1-RCK protein kinase [Blastomyces dermatitidis ATCC 18188]EQL30880.1 CAMK/CAMK1/CAMK1-RCK protein kinase [Blastomyces dermatitidis ATCC 26199]
MSTIQSLKNFIRHGKQARVATPHAEPTTNVSTIHAEQQKQPQGQYPAIRGLDALDCRLPPKDASNAPGSKQTGTAANKGSRVHESEIEQIIAEERRSRSMMPKYPGLERWELVEKMGDGAFSNVYRARDTTGKFKEVAIKVVRKFEMNSKQGEAHLHPDLKKKQKQVVERANILKEVQIMRQIDHPNIVKLIEFSESRQFYYIVLELCPGGELFHQIVRLTYFSEDLSRHVILQVAKAIEYLHEHCGVVHRDIKPENLLFYPVPFIPTKNPKPPAPGDEEKADEGEFTPGVGGGGIGQIKVADFGLSKVIWDSETMTPCGTVGYTAPEIVKDERYSKSVDMWALGCVLYTLLCGFPPFYDESIQVLTEKVARGQYTFLSPWWDDISKPAQDLVSHLLTVDPEKRFTIKEFLQHPWIKQTNEETHAAADAPPLATPSALHAQFLETPAAVMDRKMDFRSPGAINLREVFDVSYAVHRQEEEGKRRNNFKQGFHAPLNPLNEDFDDDNSDNDEDLEGIIYYDQDKHAANPAKVTPRAGHNPTEVATMEAKLKSTNLNATAATQPSAAAQARQREQQQQRQRQAPRQQGGGGYGTHSSTVAAAARENAARSARQPFELSLDNATLLGRRGRRLQGQKVV